jgi:hypothetical protein
MVDKIYFVKIRFKNHLSKKISNKEDEGKWHN